MIMTVDTISDCRYPVWTTAPYCLNDNHSWYNIWSQIPCVNYFSSLIKWYWQLIQYLIQDTLCELLLFINKLLMAQYLLINKLIMTVDTISDPRYPVWTSAPHWLNDNHSWYNIWSQIPCVNYFSSLFKW